MALEKGSYCVRSTKTGQFLKAGLIHEDNVVGFESLLHVWAPHILHIFIIYVYF